MSELNAAPDHTLFLNPSEESRYKHLAALAKHHGRIPTNWEITFNGHRESGKYQIVVRLGPLPAWQTRVLEPIPVPSRLKDLNEIVAALQASTTFLAQGAATRKRALRLMQALTEAATEDGFKVRGRPAQRFGSYGDARRDEVEFKRGFREFKVYFEQPIDKVPHEPTEKELARAKRGHLFPDVDDVPSEHLTLRLEGPGDQFWASSWSDSEREDSPHRLEDDLAQILEEMRLRHGKLQEEFEAQREWARESLAKDERDKATAAELFRERYVLDAMRDQAQRWQEANLLRDYAAAILARAGSDPAARDWAKQIEDEAQQVDPFPLGLLAPVIPEPTKMQIYEIQRDLS